MEQFGVPDAIFRHILAHLPIKDVWSCMRVCKKWKNTARVHSCWEIACFRDLLDLCPIKPKAPYAREYTYSRAFQEFDFEKEDRNVDWYKRFISMREGLIPELMKCRILPEYLAMKLIKKVKFECEI